MHVVASCDVVYWDFTISQCITNDLLASSPAYACLASAKSCSDVYKCTGIGPASAAQTTVANNADGGACVQDIAVNGDSAPYFGIDIYRNCDILAACAPRMR